jgi:cytochrome oxidase Cu insertion factor (SCO1/SenC/PrrC family)
LIALETASCALQAVAGLGPRRPRRVYKKGGIMLNPGDKAPDFVGRDHNGNTVKLADFKGKNVVLWFFPKADTPG